MNKIFTQLAAYSGTELIPTINDAVMKAEHPERLGFPNLPESQKYGSNKVQQPERKNA